MAPVTPEWKVYVIRCGDGSLYTGIAKDVDDRIARHRAGRGARYTRGRGPVELIGQVGPMTLSNALKLERRVKKARGPRKLVVLATGVSESADVRNAGA